MREDAVENAKRLCRELDEALVKAREIQKRIIELEDRMLKLLEDISQECLSAETIGKFYDDMGE